MLKVFHRAITERALSDLVCPRALKVILAANLKQDNLLTGQIGHPEYHFDENAFAASREYMEAQRARIRPLLEAGNPIPAWKAFGRLIHAAQDLYAHSNYVSQWLARYPQGGWPPPATIEPCDEAILASPDLHSGKLYLPLEVLSFLPLCRDWVMPRLPRDSHAWMNLDSPERGPLFEYACEAALRRTRLEYEITIHPLPPGLQAVFLCLSSGSGHPRPCEV